MNIKPPFSRAARLQVRHERFPSIFRNKLQHGVLLVGWIGSKIDSREELLEHSAGEYRNFQVRSLRNAAGTWDASRPDGLKLATAVSIGGHATEAAPARIVFTPQNRAVLTISG